MSDALEQCQQFFAAIFDPGDVVEFRPLPRAPKRWTRADDIGQVVTELGRLNATERHCYFGANPRTGKGGSTAEAVALARCLFADFDGGVSANEARERIATAGLPEPTAIVFTGGGVHCWWRLTEPMTDDDAWHVRMKAIAQALGSDQSICDWPRIMRLPGFTNWKHDHKPLASLVDVDPARVYSLEQLRPTSRRMSTRAKAFLDSGTLIGGEGRRGSMFAVACDLRDHGWDVADAEAAIMRRMRMFDLTAEDLADAPRQIRNAWKREPRAITAAPAKPPAAAFQPFPADELPEPLAAFVREGSEALGCDETYLALPLLASAGAAIGTTRLLETKAGWGVPAMIWCVAVGESGTGKSPALAAALEYVRSRESELRRVHAGAMEEYEADLAAYEANLAEWRKRAAAGRTSGEERPQKPEPPIARRGILTDATVEAIAPILADNPRGVLVGRDELAGWLGGMDRYVGKSRVSADEPFYLSCYNGQPHTVDRRTGDRRSIHVELAALWVCGTIQPGVLRRCIGAGQRENGLLARLLLAAPPQRPKVWTEATISPLTRERLRSTLDRLYMLRHDGRFETPTAKIVRPNADAKRLWVEHYNEHNREAVDLAGDLRAAWGKLEETVARLALIFHMVKVAAHDPLSGDDEPDADVVDAATMAAAIRVVDWFKAETRRVYAMLDESAADEAARQEDERLAAWIERRGGRVATRDLIAGCRGIATADAAEAALNRLEQAGLGRWQAKPPGEHGGRPGTLFVLDRSTASAEPPDSREKTGSACADTRSETEFVEI